MKIVMKASDIGSTLTHKPAGRGLAVFKTLDQGQYAIQAKNIKMENAKSGEVWELGSSTPVYASPKAELESIDPAALGVYEAVTATPSISEGTV